LSTDNRAFARAFSRRAALKGGGAALLATQAGLLEQIAIAPNRLAMAAGAPSDIQFDIGNFIPPAQTINGVVVRFATVFTLFVPARLTRNPTKADQTTLANSLNTIEANVPFSPSGVFTFVSYGRPYFGRLPSTLVNSRIPKLASNTSRLVLEEAVASPTDVVSGNGITKERFNVPVRIESNDVLFTLRSDSSALLANIANWVAGSNDLNGRTVASPAFNGLFSFQTPRLMFQQNGLPRQVANSAGLPYRDRINPQSPMWMGFADQQVNASGPAPIVTFVGNSSAHLTTARAGDYFDNGSIQHLSHDILDLAQFYANAAEDPPEGETYKERLQYMFRSNQRGTKDGLISDGNTDQFTNGGGPAFLPNTFQGTGDALANINVSGKVFDPATGQGTFEGEHRMGHIAALQRSSRAADGTPLHIRMDGAGFTSLDVPDGSTQPTLEFTAFVPTAEFFRAMRANTAALDIIKANGNLVPEEDNGLERFITATRRQNFLCPPRRHRAFPLLELT
jgi:hypothetical protein